MAGVRIRWRGVARAVAIVVVGLLVLRVVPSLLRAPVPPPLGRDVGLPRSKPRPVVDVPVPTVAKHRRPRPAVARRKRHGGPKHHAPRRNVADAPASRAVIGTRHRRRTPNEGPPARHRRRSSSLPKASGEPVPKAAETTPPPVPEYVPPPAPEPQPEPAPAPASAPPSMPGDGSEEFAPH